MTTYQIHIINNFIPKYLKGYIMKSILNLLFTAAIFFSISSQAGETDKDQLIRFAKAVGIYEQIEEQKIAIQAQGAQAAQQYVKQIMASTPGLPHQFNNDMEDEMKVYMSNLASLIDTDFAVDAYINLISKKLTSSEIQKLTEFYESDLGKKFTRSNTEIMGDWTLEFMGDFDRKMVAHLQSFVTNLMAKASNYSRGQQP